MRVSRDIAAANRARVVDTAARLFRERGYNGIGVADLMKAAGLTHGAFARQFGTKDALFAEACARAFAEPSSASEEGGMAERIDGYLSRQHRDRPGDGCAIPSLSPDVARAAPDAQLAFASKVTELVDEFGRLLAKDGADVATDRDRALFLLSSMSGAVMLSRALAGAAPEMADALLEATATELKRHLEKD